MASLRVSEPFAAMAPPLLLFAHGAGASSGSEWMLHWRRRLASLWQVESFDYRYMREGRKLPDRLPMLIEEHASWIDALQSKHPARPLFVVGKSMGSRVGCHVSLTRSVAGIACFGYPLVGAGKSKPRRDEVLRNLQTPILFVQGTRDRLCPLADLEEVRAQMTAPQRVHVVEGGDHSLLVRKRDPLSQSEVDDEIVSEICDFVTRWS